MATWLAAVGRSMVKHKAFTVVSALGWMLGIGSFIAVLLYVFDELQFDRFHERAALIYRINVTTSYDGTDTRYPTSAAPLAEYVSRDIPDVLMAGRLFEREATLQVLRQDSSLVADQKFRERHFYFADPKVLEMFTFKFIAGNAENALKEPNYIVLSARVASRYFGSPSSAIGKLLMFEGVIPMEVSGVFEDWPPQSSNTIEVVAHFSNYYALEAPGVQDFLKRDWLYNPLQTYIVLRPGADASAVTALIQTLNNRYADERVRDHVRYDLQPLTEIHLHSDFTHASDRNTITYVYIFTAVGVLILIIAAINFVNLSTVHFLRRAKEIGVRKVIGASSGMLRWQFIAESCTLTVASGLCACLAVYLALPLINMLTGKQLDWPALTSPELLAVVFSVVTLTGVVAAVYPAFYISRINPVRALKGLKMTVSGGHFVVRRALVTLQFAASITLIAFTLVIRKQMMYMNNMPLGFQKDFMLTVPLFSGNPNAVLGGGVDGELRQRMNSFEHEVSGRANVEAVSVSSTLPGQGAVFALVTTDSIKEDANLFIPVVSVDYDFTDTYKMEVIAGRSFNREAGTDHLGGFVANEEALKVLGFRDAANAVGKHVNALGKQGTIVGVIRNYHFQGLQQPLRPLLMEVNVSKFTVFSLRLNALDIPSSIQSVKKIWDDLFPERVFEYRFLDEQLAGAYDSERRFANLINVFSGLAVLIASLGLVGLAAYVSVQREKEAAIRKVLGATHGQVFVALSKEFLRVFVMATAVALPLAYLIASSWLGNFAYHVGVGWIPLLKAAVTTFLIISLTTVYQTLRTASANPAQTIRNE